MYKLAAAGPTKWMDPRTGPKVQGRVCWESPKSHTFPILNRKPDSGDMSHPFPNQSALNLNLICGAVKIISCKRLSTMPLLTAYMPYIFALGDGQKRKQAKRACSKGKKRCEGGWCRRGHCVSNTRKIVCLGSNGMWIMLDCMFAHRVCVGARRAVARSCWYLWDGRSTAGRRPYGSLGVERLKFL